MNAHIFTHSLSRQESFNGNKVICYHCGKAFCKEVTNYQVPSKCSGNGGAVMVVVLVAVLEQVLVQGGGAAVAVAAVRAADFERKDVCYDGCFLSATLNTLSLICSVALALVLLVLVMLLVAVINAVVALAVLTVVVGAVAAFCSSKSRYQYQ